MLRKPSTASTALLALESTKGARGSVGYWDSDLDTFLFQQARHFIALVLMRSAEAQRKQGARPCFAGIAFLWGAEGTNVWSLPLEVRCDWPQGRYLSPSLREVVHLPAFFVHMPAAMRSASDFAMASGWCRKMRVKDRKKKDFLNH